MSAEPRYQLDLDTQISCVSRDDKGARYDVEISDHWRVIVGPNGGYLAALLLKVMRDQLAHDPRVEGKKPTRSLTLQYLNPSKPGPATISVRNEKVSKRLAVITARLEQAGVLITLATAHFGDARMAVNFKDHPMPMCDKPSAVAPERWMSPAHPWYVAFRDQFEQCTTIGSFPPSQSERALSGGWMRFRDLRPLDDIGLAAISDAWYPSLVTKRLDASFHCPTLEHTVYFHSAPPVEDLDQFCLVQFEAKASTDGFVEETGCIWSASGQVLATTHQLAALTEWNEESRARRPAR
ncbi:MAG: thioesterase family protein [Pseudomonadales bacterium]